MGKYTIIAISIIVIAVLSLQTFGLFKKSEGISGQLRASSEKMEELQKENDQLRAQIDYVSRDENFEKELRAKFNYKKPEERMLIITP